MNLPNVFSDYFTPQAVVDLWLKQCNLYRKMQEMLEDPDADIIMQTPEYAELVDNLHIINEAMDKNK